MHRFSPLPAILAMSGIALLFTPPSSQAEVQPLNLSLPTDNTALFSGDPSQYYMYTDRNFEGVQSKPWTAGKYGFVRDQKRTAAGVISTKFHEGMDIRPVKRDAANRPLDTVRPIAPGKVVYVSLTPGHSSYGNYVVVEHEWGYGPFYSLYAHLMSASVKAGQKVTTATTLGRMGYTGDGINIERSHLHVELNFLLSKKFPAWHDRYFNTPNYHGLYNGLNLIGLDIGDLFLQQRKNPDLTIPEYLAKAEAYCKVLVPNRGKPEVLTRYPFLGKNMDQPVGSWEFTFTQAGVPLSISPSA